MVYLLVTTAILNMRMAILLRANFETIPSIMGHIRLLQMEAILLAIIKMANQMEVPGIIETEK